MMMIAEEDLPVVGKALAVYAVLLAHQPSSPAVSEMKRTVARLIKTLGAEDFLENAGFAALEAAMRKVGAPR